MLVNITHIKIHPLDFPKHVAFQPEQYHAKGYSPDKFYKTVQDNQDNQDTFLNRFTRRFFGG